MSNTHIAREWLQARKDLLKIIDADKALLEGKRIEERTDAISQYLDLYYRYRKMVQRLTSCHDQMVQPQIRPLVGKMLDNCILRMLEYRREIVDITFTECGWSVEPMLRLKMTPDDTELSAPIYDGALRRAEFERRRQLAEEAQLANANQPTTDAEQDGEASEITSLSSLSTMPEPAPAPDDEAQQSKANLRAGSRGKRAAGVESEVIQAPSSQFSMIRETPEERAEREALEAQRKKLHDAALLIQAHERARIGRRITRALEFRIEFERKMLAGEIDDREPSLEEQNRAASMIQKAWRRFLERRLEKMRQDESEVMREHAYPCRTSNKLIEQAEKNFAERQEMQAAAVQKLKDSIQTAKKKIWESRTDRLREDIRDEIREWWFTWLNEIGRMDVLPSPEYGGSIRVVTGESRTPDEYLAALAAAKEKKKPKEEKNEEEGAEDDEEGEEQGFGLQPSLAIPGLDEANEEFERDWGLRSEQILDPDAALVMQLETDELNCQLQLEVRPMADEDMRELQQPLNRALLVDHAKDENPFVLPQPEVFIDPEEEADKSKKKPPKEKPDPLADVPESELLLEMSKWKVMRDDVPKKRISDWPGAETYAEKLPHLCCVGDVKHPVIDYCVLPMGSKIVHELAPLVRSVAICGPANSGQLDLAHAVCTELQATVFDLTPERHIGRFVGKKSQDRLVQVLMKLAKMYAPSVILVENENAFRKKMTAELYGVQPKRFAPVYKKIVKLIKPGDQVLFLTASQEPFLTARSFISLHDKLILIPPVDYGTAYLSIKRPLMSNCAISRRWHVSFSARMLTRKTSWGVVRDAATLSVARRIQLGHKPFHQTELCSRINAIDKPNITKWDKWYEKTSTVKKRRQLEKEELMPQPEDPKKKK